MCMHAGYIASLRNDTSFTSRPVEIADSRGEARTLAGALHPASPYSLRPSWSLDDLARSLLNARVIWMSFRCCESIEVCSNHALGMLTYVIYQPVRQGCMQRPITSRCCDRCP